MRTLNYVVKDDDDGKQIKHILRQKLGVSAAVLTRLKKTQGGIKLNGECVFATHRVVCGDNIEITLADNSSENIVPSDVPLNIIYEDEDILVVNKPPSMPTHPSHGHHNDTLANAVVGHYKNKEFTFRVITRLDRDTSGVVVVAGNKISASNLTSQMTKGEITKEYEAICHMWPTDDAGTIEAPIARKEGSAILREVSESGKRAVTKYEVLSKSEGLSHIRLFPITGRTHQIRVHLSHIGVPIYGDDLYGSPIVGERVRLHCRKITLRHPITGDIMIFEAPLPDDMNM